MGNKRPSAYCAIIDAYREGVAAETNKTVSVPTTAAHSLSVRQSFNSPKQDRDAEIRQLREAEGWTFAELARYFHISKQRAHQIVGRKPKIGFVYLALDQKWNLHKVGCTSNRKERLANLRAEYGPQIKFTHTFRTEDAYKHEAELHRALKARNIGGEWFDLRSIDLVFVNWYFKLN